MRIQTDKNDEQLIRGLSIFSGLTAQVIDGLEGTIRNYSHGDAIFAQETDGGDLMAILHGQVCIFAGNTFLTARSTGELIGEQALIEEAPRSATAIAQGMVRVLSIPKAQVGLLLDNPLFVRNLLVCVSRKLTQATSERAFRYRQEELLFAEFRAQLSPKALDELIATGRNFGAPRFIDAVILFSDIRKFTDICSGMEAGQVADELSNYLDLVVDTIHRHEGVIDKFIGDAVMAFWGDLPTDQDMVEQALHCAQEMVRQAQGLTFGGQPIRVGVGLNAGTVFIGNVGSEHKRQFTLIGDAVNLASRFESQTKELEVDIVAGKDFADRLPVDQRDQAKEHSNIEIRGAGLQTLYAWTISEAKEK
jgi:class 3 adenylate cyclase